MTTNLKPGTAHVTLRDGVVELELDPTDAQTITISAHILRALVTMLNQRRPR